jgi:hypothetical protein
MNKYLISEAGAQLGVYFVERHNGFTAAPHQEPMIGYYAKRNDDVSEEWNSMGHGLTYDLALTSLYLLTVKGELPSPSDCFYKSYYQEN